MKKALSCLMYPGYQRPEEGWRGRESDPPRASGTQGMPDEMYAESDTEKKNLKVT